MNRKIADQWCERGILFLTLAILVFGPLATGAVRMLEFLVIQGLTVGVLVLWIARLWLQRRWEFLWPPICWAVLAFTLYGIGRYWMADVEYVARQELLRILVYAFLFFATLNNLHSQEAMRTITYTMVFLAMVLSFYAVYQFITESSRVWHFVSPYKHRGMGTYINPNHFAGFLELILPVALAYTLASRAKPVTKVFLGYASLVLLAGITVTMSRGGWIATAAVLGVLGVVLALRSTYRWAALALLIVVAGAAVYFLPRNFILKKRMETVTREISEAQTSDVRPLIWQASLRLWAEHPWWGVGPGHFDYRFPAVRPAPIQGRPDRVHNDYLNALVDWGAVGIALVFSAWGLLFLGVFQTWRYVRGSPGDLGGRNSSKFAFVLGASLGLVAILCHSLTDFNMQIPANAILAVTWMALLSAHLRFATERHWFRVRLPGRVVASLVLLGGVIYLGAQGWRRTHEYVWLENARRQSPFSPAQGEAYARAFAADPMNFEAAYRAGEAWRTQSFEGGDNYRRLATNAMTWFQSARQLNRYDPLPPLRYGMCLDWLGEPAAAEPYYHQATRLAPNNYYVTAHVGWHYLQEADYAAALPWFERSRRLFWQDNPIADTYLQLCRDRLNEAATNTAPLRLMPGSR
ncbi:MAG: O-antigen ligase family protein [Verrucomicrobia bacterium]|nr:O-antigen ligase family protein [Verrucomicrobiota bacterium]